MLVLWSLQENCKQTPLLPSFSFHISTSHKQTAIIQNPSRSSGRPTKAEKLPLRKKKKKLQRGRVFMCQSPWSTFEHRTVNEPLVMLRLLMNGIKNVLSYTEVQRPPRTTSIHSLMINLYASCVSKPPTSVFCTSEMPIVIKVTHSPSATHALTLE